jgi:hypothetical protein
VGYPRGIVYISGLDQPCGVITAKKVENMLSHHVLAGEREEHVEGVRGVYRVSARSVAVHKLLQLSTILSSSLNCVSSSNTVLL